MNWKKNLIQFVFCILFTLMVLPVEAQNNPTIQLDLNNATLTEAIRSIESQSDYRFVYDNSVSLEQRVSLKISDSNIGNVLSKLFSNKGISYEVTGNQIVLKPLVQQAAQLSNVVGTIVDSQGEPVIGATVILKNDPTKGTVTDYDGNFTLSEIPQNATIVISYVGYRPVELPANSPQLANLVLQEDSELLDEVVVVGYGVQKRRDVTTAIASLRSSDLQDKPVTSVAEAMVGRMPGVQVSQNSGEPRSNLQIKVRGTGTITAGTSPLYVVDGVPLAKEDLSTFNMNDVESIEVLKDASSSAIYGSRGSNGVVLITTKKGSEGKARVNYNGYYGWQNVSKKIEMLDAYQYADLVYDARNNSYSDRMESINKRRIANNQSPLQYSIADDNVLRLKNTNNDYNTVMPVEIYPYINREKGLTNTDWQDEIFRTAGIQNHTLSVSGGTDKIKYYTSLDYLTQDGIVIGSDFERYSARFNLDIKEGIFKFGLGLNPSYLVENAVNANGAYNASGGGVIASALHSSPIFPVYNTDGTFNFDQNAWSPNMVTMVDGVARRGNSQTQVWNPVALAMLPSDITKATRIFGNVFGEVQLIPTLSYKLNFGIDFYNDARQTFRPSTIPISNTAGNPESVAEGTSASSQRYNWLFEQTLNFVKNTNGHDINAMGGWTMQFQRDDDNYMFANGFISNSIKTLNAGTVTRGNSGASEWSLLSALARVQYSYLGKYMATAAIRADGASRFGKDNKWGIFPSASVGWRMTEEDFMKDISFINDLKLRASYGLTGNFRIPNYGAQGEIGYYSYVLGGSTPSVVTGAAPRSMPNPSLRWEKTAQVNLGFDASLFSNFLSMGLDVYNSNTYDLLLNVPIPRTTGYATRLENIGKVNNKGIEFNIGTNYQKGDFTWSTYFNISHNINEVKELGPGNAPIIQSGSVGNAYFITRVGDPIGSYYLPVVEGVFKNQAEVDASLHYIDSPTNYGFQDSKPGDFKFKDVNGDGILDISDTDRTIVGNYAPDFTYGFGTSLAWKGVDFNVAFQGVYGNEILNLSRRYFYNHEGNMNNYIGALDRWKSETDTGSGMNVRANRVSKGQNGTTSTWHVEDGSYLRIKNITLGYTLPKNILNNLYVEKVRIYSSVQNPFTFTKYEGYNPEVSNRTTATTSGEDYGMYPLARTITLGLNIQF
ncbi:SusC/RagA family TonB-linked outer membrane protein [Petrimonas sp.]|uniref:SusC/RagA family TonB-linked outer membrane protein n=1 Tax=Petrimonas sp. TaxID=2023866 RepID=UPI003F51009D